MSRSFRAASSEIAAYTTGALLTAVPVTLVAWVRLTAVSTVTRTIIALRDKDNAIASRQCFNLEMDNLEQIAARIGGSGASSSATHASAVVAGEWTHAAAVFTSDTAYKAFRNGSGTSAVGTSRVPAGVDSAQVGGSLISTSSVGQPWNGEIFWPAVWNVTLTDDEIALLSAGMSPELIRPNNLVFFAREDDQRHILLDAANGKHMTLTGTEFVPSIPARVAARLPHRTARIYGFPSGGAITITQGTPEALVIAEQAGTVRLSIPITQGSAEALVLAEQTGTVRLSIPVTQTAAEALVLAEQVGTVRLSIPVTQGASEALVLAEQVGTVTLGSGISITQGAAEALVLGEQTGTVRLSMPIVQAAAEALVINELGGTVTLGSVLNNPSTGGGRTYSYIPDKKKKKSPPDRTLERTPERTPESTSESRKEKPYTVAGKLGAITDKPATGIDNVVQLPVKPQVVSVEELVNRAVKQAVQKAMAEIQSSDDSQKILKQLEKEEAELSLSEVESLLLLAMVE